MVLKSIFLGEAKVMMKYLLRANWLSTCIGRNPGSTVETSRLNGQKSFKNVVWIYWMKSRCLYICTVTFFTIYSGISCLIICFNTRDNVLEGVLA